MHDPRDAAAQYRLERLRGAAARAGSEDPDAAGRRVADATGPADADAAGRRVADATGPADADAPAEASATARTPTATDRAAYVETVIQQAIRRGDFDDLPGAGKPLRLGDAHDPDWWIRRKIQSEQLSGLGPPALALRVEHSRLDARLDAMTREADVREHIEDFNRRVIEARRQLLGGPPVVTRTRDVDSEVAAWHERRAARLRAQAEAREQAADAAAAPRRRRTRWRSSR